MSNLPNQYVVPALPGLDPRVNRVIQDLADRVNYLTTELDRVRGGMPDPGARRENPQPGFITIPSPSGDGDGFIRVNEDGVIKSYTNPTVVGGMRRNLFLDYTTTTTVANTTTETSLLGNGDFGSTKIIDPSIIAVG